MPSSASTGRLSPNNRADAETQRGLSLHRHQLSCAGGDRHPCVRPAVLDSDRRAARADGFCLPGIHRPARLQQPDAVEAVLQKSNLLGHPRHLVRDDGALHLAARSGPRHPRPEPEPWSRDGPILTVRAGSAFNPESPPHVAIWLENASFYHIKTLHLPDEAVRESLPYWDFKVRGWQEAKQEAERAPEDTADDELVGISSATPNSSFDPADYLLPGDPDSPTSYRLLIEVDQPEDDQASLVYAVEIDNADPQVFQLLELVGYPRREDGPGGKEEWALYYIDEGFDSALNLVDSALLTIERGGSKNER